MREYTIEELANIAHYSPDHFRRIFMEQMGIPIKQYMTRRKLEYARYDIFQGRRILDVALEYGFETHAGFTKTFKKVFGYPPSLYRLHGGALPVDYFRNAQKGEQKMQVQIRKQEPLTIIGYASRHTMPGTYSCTVGDGLYAIFSTPWAEEDNYVQSIRDTWREILECWLPESQYEYDIRRQAYEYYDERDHGPAQQMDICVPICKR